MTSRPIRLAGVLLALALAGCAGTVPASTGGSAPASARVPVPATGAGLWFAPLPTASDYMSLFASGASWSNAASHTAVFQLDGPSVQQVSDADLASIVAGLNRAGLPIAVKVGALMPGGNCNLATPAFQGDKAVPLLRRLKAASAAVRFVVMDAPYAAGTTCESAEQVGVQVAAWVKGVRAVSPQAGIGDAEPLLSPQDGAAQVQWITAYATSAGSPLAFLHLDIDWSLRNWPSQVDGIESAARSAGTGFGITYAGNDDDDTDALWLAHAADRMAAYRTQSPGLIDSAIFASTPQRPQRLLPETDRTAFTALIDQFGGRASALTLAPGPTAADGTHVVTGTLADASGKPIANAPVDLAVRSLSATGEFATYTATGTIPANAGRASLAFRLDTEGADSGPAGFDLYEASFKEGSSERFGNPTFTQGTGRWGIGSSPASLMASDRGDGQMLQVADDSAQPVSVNTEPFGVTPGATFTVTFGARVTPVSRGYFTVLFLSNLEVSRVILRFKPALAHLTATSDASGNLKWHIPAGEFPAELDARYAGDAGRWPAPATLTLSS